VSGDAFFLGEERLLRGPWQAFERDVARLLIANGFTDVRIVGGTGDRGADVLGAKEGQLWVFQCKYSASASPPSAAIHEVVEAGAFYGAQRLVVATSRPPSDGFHEERLRFERQGLKVEIADPGVLLELMRSSPEYAPGRKALYEFQDGVARMFRDALIDTGRAQAILATGLGKTVIMAEVVASLLRDGIVDSGRVLVLAHTRELVDQLQRSFWYQLPKWVATHRLSDGEVPSYWEGITFATIQSVSARLESLPHFGLVLVDEAHHAGAQVFRTTIEALGAKMLGGVTATPWRGDGYDVDRILGPAVVRMGIADGLRYGFLSDIEYRLLADNIDWDFVQTASAHRYSLTQLNRKLIIPTRDEEAVRVVRDAFDREGRRAAIAFSPTIVHAELFASMLRRYSFRAEAISSETPARDRAVLMARFKAGQLDIITTVDLFNEGVDVPDVDLVVFLRATHSRRIFVQQLGRGLRVSPNKYRLLVLDFVTDLRRIAEVIELDKASRDGDVEHLGMHGRLVQFSDRTAGDFLREWLLDQASLLLREDDPTLDLPRFEFPEPPASGAVQ